MRLKELRLEKNLSQEEVAKAIGTSQRNIGRWENGENEPAVSMAVKIALFFEVSTDYLLEIEDDFGIKKTDGAVAPSAYSKEEQKIIEDYRRLNYMSKKLVLQTLATLQPSASETKQKKKGNN